MAELLVGLGKLASPACQTAARSVIAAGGLTIALDVGAWADAAPSVQRIEALIAPLPARAPGGGTVPAASSEAP
jgi:hypothetical protein